MHRFLTHKAAFAAIAAIALAGVIVAGAAAAGSGGNDPVDDRVQPTLPPDLPEPPGDRESVPAPIDDVSISIAESFPPQYFLRVVSGQPGGCYEFEGYDVDRQGNDVIVTVTNTVPENLAVMLCTMEYRTTESNIGLGSDFEPGETYQVIINGEKVTEFVAQ